MLSSRYPRLHEALGLGPMWLKRSARLAENARPESQRLPENGQTELRTAPAAEQRLPENRHNGISAKPKCRFKFSGSLQHGLKAT